MALPSEARLHSQLPREEVGVNLKERMFGGMAPPGPLLFMLFSMKCLFCSLKQDFSFRIAAQHGTAVIQPAQVGVWGPQLSHVPAGVPTRTLPF